ncbi:MAG: NAD-dependent epimerase/dehydratase family protein [Saprospiraceae bacterium]|nr:NAD-dependent epimerase/dehydratase family protein [Saprospiraceae bacterium]
MARTIVFVTGATGFVGSYILRYLIRGNYRVKALRRSTSSMDLVSDIQDKIEWIEGDILDLPFLEEALIGVNQVYHAAAVVSSNHRQVSHMLKVNIEGTANIVNASLYRGVSKFIHLSSTAALGKREFQVNIDENNYWENSRLNSNYAISKFKSECEVWRGIQEGLNANILNPAIIIGAGFWNSGACKIFKNIINGLNYYPQGGHGFVDVRDVARIALVLMESNISGERYILNAQNYSYKEFFSMASLALGKVPPEKKENPFIMAIFYQFDRLLSKLLIPTPFFTKNTIKTSRKTYCYINKKIKRDLNVEFISVPESIKETADVFLDCHKLKTAYGTMSID